MTSYFVVNLEMVEVWLYNNDVDLNQFISIDDMGRPINLFLSREIIEIGWLTKEFAWSSNLQQEKILIRNLKHGNKWVIKTYLHFIRLLIKLAHILGLRKNLPNKIRSRLLNDHAFKRIDDVHAKSYDMLIEVNIGTKYKIIPICVSANLLDDY